MSAIKDSLFGGKGLRNQPSKVDRDLWESCPTLNRVRQRLGAEIVSFRKAVVFEEADRGYKRVAATIRITADGKVVCDPSSLTITDEEKIAIAAEVQQAKFPQSIATMKSPNELSAIDREHLFVFRERYALSGTRKERNGKRNEECFPITMILQRKESSDGSTKMYLPWSYWDDGTWRMCEPDGLLALYGLNRLSDPKAEIWIHEGPKAARTAQRIADAIKGEPKATHPWYTWMKFAVHIGWPGGATNPDRVDWAPIRRLSPDTRIVIVCDNDEPGVNAAASISRTLERKVTVIRFGDKFPMGFDLADDWPEHPEWISASGTYVGPTPLDLEAPATWATSYKKSEGKAGRPKTSIRKQFAEEWYWIVDPSLFVWRRMPHRLFSAEVFDALVRPYSDVERTSALLRMVLASQIDGVIYRPGCPDLIIAEKGRRLLNTFKPSEVIPAKKDATPFIEFMKHLFPEEADRKEVLRWCATLIAKPEIRMGYGLLLVSEAQGVGKTTLAESILVPLIGIHNASFPDEKAVTSSDFNGWIAKRRLAVVNEIYAGHNHKAYDQLKSAMTDKYVQVNEKYEKPYTLENYVHIFACSNSHRALQIQDTDRRWLVPLVTSLGKPKEYWQKLHEWLNGEGLSAILHWAEKYLESAEYVRAGEHAPMTGAKRDMITESRTPGVQLAFDLAEEAMRRASRGEQVVMSLDEIQKWIQVARGMISPDKLEGRDKLLAALKSGGMLEPAREAGKDTPRYTIERGKKSRVVANFQISAGTKWEDIRAFYKMPSDLMAQEM